VLVAPADLLGGQRLVAVLGHRGPEGLGEVHRVDDAAIVERLADLVLRPDVLVPVVDELDDVGVHLEAGPRGVEGGALVALGPVAGRDHVGLAGRPPVADEVVHREVDGGRLLHRDLVHHPPARHEDPRRVDAPDLEPRGLLLLARVVHREQGQLEAVQARQLLERRVGFLAVGAVVIDVDDLLALELVEPALLLADVADDRRSLAPVGGREGEHPREPPPVGGRGHAVAHRVDHDLVHSRLGDQLVGDGSAEGVEDHRAAVLALEPLVALDPLLGVVLGLALLHHQADAVHAPVALVDHGEVIPEPVGERGAARGVGTGAVDGRGDEHLLGLGRNDAGRGTRDDEQGQQHDHDTS